MESFSDERNPGKKWPETETRCSKIFVINVQCATMKYEIIRKPMVLDRVETNSLKSAYYDYKQNFDMIP